MSLLILRFFLHYYNYIVCLCYPYILSLPTMITGSKTYLACRKLKPSQKITSVQHVLEANMRSAYQQL